MYGCSPACLWLWIGLWNTQQEWFWAALKHGSHGKLFICLFIPCNKKIHKQNLPFPLKCPNLCAWIVYTTPSSVCLDHTQCLNNLQALGELQGHKQVLVPLVLQRGNWGTFGASSLPRSQAEQDFRSRRTNVGRSAEDLIFAGPKSRGCGVLPCILFVTLADSHSSFPESSLGQEKLLFTSLQPVQDNRIFLLSNIHLASPFLT